MDDPTLLRYSRHLLLEEIGIAGQQRIGRARALVLGLGGLGSPAASYLAASGVGRLVLVDDDTVELTNLQRQLLHAEDRLGLAKVESAAIGLQQINRQVQVQALRERATAAWLAPRLREIDVVLDCSDNGATRQAVNRACVAAHVPLVSGAASALSGQLAVFDFRRPDSPCYACLFGAQPMQDEPCAVTGILAPLAGMVGTLQALEVLRLLHPFGESSSGTLLAVDASSMVLRRLHFERDPRCPVCSGGAGAGA